MTGLRERQKANRRRRILAAAVEWFQREGYRAARIEAVAEAAEVSVGTVYNHFSTKGDILMAVVTLEVEEVLTEAEAIVDAPPPGAQSALGALTRLYYDHSLHYLSKEMWRAAIAIWAEAPETPNGRRYAELDARLAAQAGRLVARLQSRGEARADLDAGAVGELAFNNLNQVFIAFVRDDPMTLPALHARIGRTTAPLARMLAPRADALRTRAPRTSTP